MNEGAFYDFGYDFVLLNLFKWQMLILRAQNAPPPSPPPPPPPPAVKFPRHLKNTVNTSFKKYVHHIYLRKLE